MNEKEYKKSLRQFHKHSDRHILVVETDMSFSDIQKVVALSDKIRKAGNELVGLMRKNYDQLIRTKRYRKVRKLYIYVYTQRPKARAPWKNSSY